MRAPTRPEAEAELLEAMERHQLPIRAIPDPGRRRRLRWLRAKRAVKGLLKSLNRKE